MGPATIDAEVVARLTDPEILRFLREKWDLIEREFAPNHFIFFGSRVNGVPHEWSDIDAIAVSARFAEYPFVNRSYHFKTAVEPHVAMDVLCYTPEEFEHMRHGLGVVADACREGVWLR
jgi:hypothetical protein